MVSANVAGSAVIELCPGSKHNELTCSRSPAYCVVSIASPPGAPGVQEAKSSLIISGYVLYPVAVVH